MYKLLLLCILIYLYVQTTSTVYFHKKKKISNEFHKIRFLNLGGQSGPVESKSRWPGGQIRWPRANGPVLTTCLQLTLGLLLSYCKLYFDEL